MEIIGFNSNLLAGWYNSRITSSLATSSGPSLSGASSRSSAADDVLAPWDVRGEVSSTEELRRKVLASGTFFTPLSRSEFSDIDAPEDYKALFELHQGIKRLAALAEEAKEKDTSDTRRSFLDNRFAEGLSQFDDFFDEMDLEGVNLLKGEKLSKVESDVAISRGLSEYTTSVIHKGDFDAEVANLTGDVQFTISITKSGTTTDLAINLADMGATTRSLDNVADHINTQLEAAGMISRFSRVKIGEEDDNGIVQGDEFGFKITGVSTEAVSFSAPTADPAVYLAGVSGINDSAGGMFAKYTDIASGSPTRLFSTRFEADPTVSEVEVPGGEDDETRTKTESNPLEIRASAAAADGGVYVLGETSTTTEGQTIKGENDLVLAKYDSTGKRVWTRLLGSAGESEAASIAVDSNGDVVVAGSIAGKLGDTTSIGEKDSFVAKFDESGVEQWLNRFGGTSDDSPESVAVGADGTVYVAGSAASAFGGKGHEGGVSDGYVRAIDTDGTTLYTRRVGSTGQETIASIAIADDGDLIVASQEDGHAVVRKFAAADGDSAAVWEQDLGDIVSGRIGELAIDGTDIYLTGGAEGGFSPSAPLTAHAGGTRDAFLVKMTDGASATVDYTTFIGSDATDTASSIAVSDGKVYIAGKTSGALPGGTFEGERDAFFARFDAATGALDFNTQLTGRGGIADATDILVDATGDSVLDQIGLPQGRVVYADSRVVTDRTSARDGDHFYLSSDGGRRKKITIDSDDTMRALTFKINSALVLDGTADVRRSAAGDQLRIKPGEGTTIELFAGADGKDLLKSLGVKPGAIVETLSALEDDDDESTSDAPSLFALDLPTEMDLSDQEKAEAAYEALESAMFVIQRAYRDLTTPPELKALFDGPQAGRRGGTVPQYMNAQLANLQAGLQRLSQGPAPGSGGGLLI